MSAAQWLPRFRGRRVLVVGDVMLDEYAFGEVGRISPEAPVPVVGVERRELRLGGAGNVARNLRALGAEVELVAAVGDDREGAQVVQALAAEGLEDRLLRLLPTFARAVYDVTGAGDTVLATFALALAAGAPPEEAMSLANRAAGIVVGKGGAAVCTPDELSAGEAAPLLSLEEASGLTARHRSEGRCVVFTNGCFDVLHAGHVQLLERARAAGDILVVGLNTDASIRRLKGPSRLVQGLEDRAWVLRALRAVDAVVAFDEDTPLRTILALRPEMLVKGGDYTFDTIVGAREVTGWGGRVQVVPTLEDRSTTRILRRVTGATV